MLGMEKLKLVYKNYLFQKASNLKNNKKYHKSLKYFSKVKRLSNNKLEYLMILNQLGDNYCHLHMYQKALDTYLEAEKMMVCHDETDDLHLNIALCFKKMRNFHKFIEYINRYLHYEKNKIRRALFSIDLSHAYRMIKKYNDALIHGLRAKNILKKYPRKKIEQAKACFAIALVYVEKHKYQKALCFLEASEALYHPIDMKSYREDLINLYETLAYVFNQMRYKETVVLYEKKLRGILKS